MKKTLILLYHHCNTKDFISERPDRKLFVNNKQFLKQINWLKKFYNMISLDQAIGVSKDKNFINTKPNIVITFDDGYKDNYTYALPILKEYNVPALIYLTTSWINNSNIQWRLELVDFLMNKKKIYIPNERGSWDLFNNSKINLQKIYNLISKKFVFDKPNFRNENLITIFNKNNYKIKNSKKYFLSWSLVKQIYSEGLLDFGAHTHNHPMLTKLNIDELLFEIMHSKKLIEDKLSIKVKHFAYPYGGINSASNREYNLAKKAKFKTATTSLPGVYLPKTNKYNNFKIPRMSIDGRWTFKKFKLMIMEQLN